jgi:FemAB-related protein (PEP-CTERM system-associated)
VSPESVEVVAAADSDEKAWEAFVDESPDAEAGHRWGFHQMLDDMFGLDVVRLVAKRNGTWVAVLPLVHQKSFVGRFLTSVPYLNYAGILGRDLEGRSALAGAAAAAAERLGVDRLEIRGRDGSHLPIETWLGKASYALELPTDSATLWGRLAAKLRSQIKRPTKAGFEARVLGADGRSAFYRLFARRWHELGSPVLPEAFFENLEARFPGRLEFVVVERGTDVGAVGALLVMGNRVEIPWAASAREHDPAGVNMLLYWSALERAMTLGASSFDFGRSTPGSGNARFKLQWGSSEHPLGWNVQVARKRGRIAERGTETRSVAATLWRRLPRPLAGRLGPFLAARIPY